MRQRRVRPVLAGAVSDPQSDDHEVTDPWVMTDQQIAAQTPPF